MAEFFEKFEAVWAEIWAFLDKLFIRLYGADYKTPEADA